MLNKDNILNSIVRDTVVINLNSNVVQPDMIAQNGIVHGIPMVPRNEPTNEPITPPIPPPKPTDGPTKEPTKKPSNQPTKPSGAPSNSFTLSPIASTSSVVGGIAAPGLSEDIMTVAEFGKTLKKGTYSILGVPSPTTLFALEGSKHASFVLENHGCIVKMSVIQSNVSPSDAPGPSALASSTANYQSQ